MHNADNRKKMLKNKPDIKRWANYADKIKLKNNDKMTRPEE